MRASSGVSWEVSITFPINFVCSDKSAPNECGCCDNIGGQCPPGCGKNQKIHSPEGDLLYCNCENCPAFDAVCGDGLGQDSGLEGSKVNLFEYYFIESKTNTV